ncbi:MAG: ankyrin repeat domain-containing protein [Gammaproteobacteria bacterium]
MMDKNKKLIWYSERGNYEAVLSLLAEGAEVNYVDWLGNTPLGTASYWHKNDLVKLLVKHGADVNAGKDGTTPLHRACERGELELVKWLFEHGADIHMAGKFCGTPLMIACKKGHDELVDWLIAQGADINNCKNSRFSPFTLACDEGHLELAERLLVEFGADINKAGYGGTALGLACRKGNDELVRWLVERGADINGCDDDSLTPFAKACEEGHFELAKWLVERGADVNRAGKGETPLCLASRSCHFDLVSWLVSDHGADVNMLNDDGMSPLMIACEKGDEELVDFFLEQGADVNHCGRNIPKTALYLACKEFDFDIAMTLMEHGADVNIDFDDWGKSIFYYVILGLMKAKRSSSDDLDIDSVMARFVEKIDVNAPIHRSGITPMYLACKRGSVELLQCLLAHGARVDSRSTCEDKTLLGVACEYGHVEIVRCLLEHGVNPNVSYGEANQNNALKTTINFGIHYEDDGNPYTFCADENFVDSYLSVLRLLIEHGADPVISGMTSGDLKAHYFKMHEHLRKQATDRWFSTDEKTESLFTLGEKKEPVNSLSALLNSTYSDIINGALFKSARHRYYIEEFRRGLATLQQLYHHIDSENLHLRFYIDEVDTLFTSAIKRGDINLVCELIDRGANENEVDRQNMPPLHLAFKHGHFNLLKLLIEKGFDVNQLDDMGYSLLHKLAEWEVADFIINALIRWLTSHDIDVDMLSKKGYTPLMLAVENNNVNFVAQLLSIGADPDTMNQEGDTPLTIAIRNANENMVKLLLENGANPNFASVFGLDLYLFQESLFPEMPEYVTCEFTIYPLHLAIAAALGVDCSNFKNISVSEDEIHDEDDIHNEIYDQGKINYSMFLKKINDQGAESYKRIVDLLLYFGASKEVQCDFDDADFDVCFDEKTPLDLLNDLFNTITVECGAYFRGRYADVVIRAEGMKAELEAILNSTERQNFSEESDSSEYSEGESQEDIVIEESNWFGEFLMSVGASFSWKSLSEELISYQELTNQSIDFQAFSRFQHVEKGDCSSLDELPFFVALNNGWFQLAWVFLCADPNIGLSQQNLETKKLLFREIEECDANERFELARLFFFSDSGVDLNQKNLEGETLLSRTLKKSHANVVRCLRKEEDSTLVERFDVPEDMVRYLELAGLIIEQGGENTLRDLLHFINYELFYHEQERACYISLLERSRYRLISGESLLTALAQSNDEIVEKFIEVKHDIESTTTEYLEFENEVVPNELRGYIHQQLMSFPVYDRDGCSQIGEQEKSEDSEQEQGHVNAEYCHYKAWVEAKGTNLMRREGVKITDLVLNVSLKKQCDQLALDCLKQLRAIEGHEEDFQERFDLLSSVLEPEVVVMLQEDGEEKEEVKQETQQSSESVVGDADIEITETVSGNHFALLSNHSVDDSDGEKSEEQFTLEQQAP